MTFHGLDLTSLIQVIGLSYGCITVGSYVGLYLCNVVDVMRLVVNDLLLGALHFLGVLVLQLNQLLFQLLFLYFLLLDMGSKKLNVLR